MLRFLKTGINVTLAAIVFVITTSIGLIAWFLGAVVRAQLPDGALVKDETETIPHKTKAVRKTTSVSTRALTVNAYPTPQAQARKKAGRQPS